MHADQTESLLNMLDDSASRPLLTEGGDESRGHRAHRDVGPGWLRGTPEVVRRTGCSSRIYALPWERRTAGDQLRRAEADPRLCPLSSEPGEQSLAGNFVHARF